MDVERETVVEAAVSIGTVLAFVVVLIIVGSSYGGQQLDSTGALAIIGAIVAFVFVMAGVGLLLERD